jgi:hypothetical protein
MQLEDGHPVTRRLASRGRVIVIDLVIWFVSALLAERVHPVPASPKRSATDVKTQDEFAAQVS